MFVVARASVVINLRNGENGSFIRKKKKPNTVLSLAFQSVKIN